MQTRTALVILPIFPGSRHRLWSGPGLDELEHRSVRKRSWPGAVAIGIQRFPAKAVTDTRLEIRPKNNLACKPNMHAGESRFDPGKIRGQRGRGTFLFGLERRLVQPPARRAVLDMRKRLNRPTLVVQVNGTVTDLDRDGSAAVEIPSVVPVADLMDFPAAPFRACIV